MFIISHNLLEHSTRYFVQGAPLKFKVVCSFQGRAVELAYIAVAPGIQRC